MSLPPPPTEFTTPPEQDIGTMEIDNLR